MCQYKRLRAIDNLLYNKGHEIMKSELKSATKYRTPVLRRADPELVRRNFRSSFPEMTACFAYLSPGYRKGARLDALFEHYCRTLTPAQRWRLAEELDESTRLGLRPSDYDGFISDVLGMDPDVVVAEFTFAIQLVQQFYRWLQQPLVASSR